jgi:hypothetical protein
LYRFPYCSAREAITLSHFFTQHDKLLEILPRNAGIAGKTRYNLMDLTAGKSRITLDID